jgi:hypothetical protein
MARVFGLNIHSTEFDIQEPSELQRASVIPGVCLAIILA